MSKIHLFTLLAWSTPLHSHAVTESGKMTLSDMLEKVLLLRTVCVRGQHQVGEKKGEWAVGVTLTELLKLCEKEHVLLLCTVVDTQLKNCFVALVWASLNIKVKEEGSTKVSDDLRLMHFCYSSYNISINQCHFCPTLESPALSRIFSDTALSSKTT